MIGGSTYLKVITLGRFEIRRDQEVLAGGNWNRRKVCELFKLLLTAEQHRLHREQIQEILWPSFTSEQAANSFGKTLYLLRRALEPNLVPGKGNPSTYVSLDHDTLLLVSDSVKIDADSFEVSIKQLQIKARSHTARTHNVQDTSELLDEFDRTLSLYGGDYLPEDLYEDWAQRRRDRLRRFHSWLLENAAELAIESALGLRACEYLQALLENNPADEQTHRRLMVVYARMGRRSDALNQYQVLCEALKEELRANPLPETIELHHAIQAGRITVDLGETHYGTDGGPLRLLTGGSPATRDAGVESKERAIYTPAQEGAPVEPASQQTRTRPDRILNAALVGREQEVQRLQRAYAQGRASYPHIFFISGEAGIGKTRLARELTSWLETTQKAIVLRGYCYEMSGSLPYQPIADAISTLVRGYSPEQLRQMLGQRAVDLAKIVPEIRSKLPDLPQPEPLGPEEERRNLYNAVAYYFSVLASNAPVTIILDDLQWTDAATLQLLSYLTVQSVANTLMDHTNAPYYLLLYRADEVHEDHPLRSLLATLMRTNYAEEVRLKRLNEEAVQQLLVNMAGHEVRPIFAMELYRHTEGNPFFIGEVVRTLLEEGKIKRVDERWQIIVPLEELTLPQSLRLLIERRLVQFSPACRAMLAVAAVLGRQFNSAVLCQALKLPEEIVAEYIDEAIRAQILLPTTEATLDVHRQDVDLAFTHDKIREVLYQGLNPLRKRSVHRQVAQAIEARYATRLQPYYSSLAHHYQIAEDVPRAVDYFVKAAAHASAVYAFVDAVTCLEEALELLIGDDDRIARAELLRQLADVYLYTGRPDKSIEAGRASCTLWRDLGDVVKEAEARLDVAFAFHWQGREATAVEYIKRALECLESQPGEKRLLAKAYAQWGMTETSMGHITIALEHLRQADTLHTQIGGKDPFIAVVTLWSRSWCALLVESPLQMLEYATRSAEVCRIWRMFAWEPMMTYTVAWAQMLLGRIGESERTAHETLEKAQRHNAVGAQGWANLMLAFLAIQSAQWDRAEQCGDKAFAIAAMLHDENLHARISWGRSICAGWQGDWSRAIYNINEALRVIQQGGEALMMYPYFLLQAATASFYADQLIDAQSYLDQAMHHGRMLGYRQLSAMGLCLQGRLLQARNNFEAAQPFFEQALADLAALDDGVEHARTLEAYGLFYLARNREGDNARGLELLDSARATLKRLVQ